MNEGMAPVDTRMGEELDCRLYTDLSRIHENSLVTPSQTFYIRSGASELLPSSAAWTITLDGLVDRPVQLTIESLRRAARPLGRHLMECAGNVRLTRFGLISVADWSGVPVMDVLKGVSPKPGASRILISGFDDYATESRTSVPGASWIFRPEDLQNAFLSTEMNGQPLTRDHGAPLRLVVPGWYGCSCIKWVNRISFVEDGAETTSQMREYAVRTLQDGVPQYARDFAPPIIEPAAMPVRVEKWSDNGRLHYRILGIAWGGIQPIQALGIRFQPDEDFQPVPGFRRSNIDVWTLWSYFWTPRHPGTYAIQLAVTAPKVQARKLDAGFYVRWVNIRET